MSEINLLPQEKKDAGYSVKIGSQGKKVLRIGGILVVVAILVYACIFGFFFVSNLLVIDSTEDLETQIKSLQPTEQKIVLLRDRLSKTKSVLSNPSSKDEALALTTISESLPEGVTIQGAKVLPEELVLTVNTDESAKVTEFIRSLISSGLYRHIEMGSMSFSSNERYIVEIKTVNSTQN